MVKFADIEKNAGKNVLYQSSGDDIFDSKTKEFKIKCKTQAGFTFETSGKFADVAANEETTTVMVPNVNAKFALKHLLPSAVRVSPVDAIQIKKFKCKADGSIDLEAQLDGLVGGLTSKFVSKTSCNFANPFDAFTLKNDFKKDDIYVHSAMDLKDLKVNKLKAGAAYTAGDFVGGAETTFAQKKGDESGMEMSDLSVKAGYSAGKVNAAAVFTGLTTKPSYKLTGTFAFNDKTNFGGEVTCTPSKDGDAKGAAVDFGLGASFQIDSASKVHAKAGSAGDVQLYYSNAVCAGLETSISAKFDTKAESDSADAFKYGFGLTFTA